jgi:hypothetical protein
MERKIGNCILISVSHYVFLILWMRENVFWGGGVLVGVLGKIGGLYISHFVHVEGIALEYHLTLNIVAFNDTHTHLSHFTHFRTLDPFDRCGYAANAPHAYTSPTNQAQRK